MQISNKKPILKCYRRRESVCHHCCRLNIYTVEFHTKKGLLQALDNVSLTIRTGEMVCPNGESGSGKTITPKSIMRLTDYENGRIAQGEIRLQYIDLTVLSQQELSSLRGKKMAMVFQEPMSAFDPVMWS
ncbi:Oligopeptide transport ATP-binding protein OppD [compost metagenome]